MTPNESAFAAATPLARVSCGVAVDRLVAVARALRAAALTEEVEDPSFDAYARDAVADDAPSVDRSAYPFDTFQLVALCGAEEWR